MEGIIFRLTVDVMYNLRLPAYYCRCAKDNCTKMSRPISLSVDYHVQIPPALESMEEEFTCQWKNPPARTYTVCPSTPFALMRLRYFRAA